MDILHSWFVCSRYIHGWHNMITHITTYTDNIWALRSSAVFRIGESPAVCSMLCVFHWDKLFVGDREVWGCPNSDILIFKLSISVFTFCTWVLNAELSCYLEIRRKSWNNIHLFCFLYLIEIWICFTLITNELRYPDDVLQCYALSFGISLGFAATASWPFDNNGEPLVSWRGPPSSHTLKRNRNHTWEVGALLCSARVSRQSLCWSHCKTQLDKINKQFYYSLVLLLTKSLANNWLSG
jgi:hypothetical protein